METPIFLTVNHVATVDRNGTEVHNVISPYQIFFQPADGLHLNDTAADFRAELAKIPLGTKLYDVFATMNEHVTKPILVGSVITESPFIASEYSDRKLYFQHEGSIRRSFWLGRKIVKSPTHWPIE